MNVGLKETKRRAHGPWFQSGFHFGKQIVKVAKGRFSPIFAFSAHPSAELDLRVHNVGLDAS